MFSELDLKLVIVLFQTHETTHGVCAIRYNNNAFTYSMFLNCRAHYTYIPYHIKMQKSKIDSGSR